ncbi:hypothetical protein DICPUDRAFT_78286 [Dictyostelium purpureum]|uniref:Sugar transporter SWEET1 n=1 Tax=Dictyostelium purpureum TaxID=5786 RepID=F0ZJ41_DICPU|nr:uncharacterized protein DICPUDRAFT_78286 [Dictyostelium purpureum]EGC36063.1 hypothetical protein DICPUDRAFT_78286 [Dictyostelium purpureum]|eukprot:XP_003287438.1 hypothetical protein DICPUDRAFT_78286 [Dictyostelium purpureum]
MATNPDQQILLGFIQLIAIVSTLGVFFMPLKTILNIKEKRTVGSVAGIQFLSTALNCFLWIAYGILTGNGTMLFTNSVGLLLAFYYVYNYWLYSSSRDYLYKIMVASILAISIIFISFVGTNNNFDQRVERLGFQASVVCILMFAAPLERLFQIIKIKNSEGMLKGVAVLSMMCSLSWLVFGLLIIDKYIYIPNFLASLISITQLLVILKYPPSPQLL